MIYISTLEESSVDTVEQHTFVASVATHFGILSTGRIPPVIDTMHVRIVLFCKRLPS